MSDFFPGLIENMVLAAVAATGFGLSFNVPRRVLWFCAAGGAIGRGLRYLLMTSPAHLDIEWATFIAATVVSLLSVAIAQRLRAHPKVFTVAAMIPMIPGVSLFTALIAVAKIQQHGVSDALLNTAISSGLEASFVIAALAVGLAVPGMLIYRRRPVV